MDENPYSASDVAPSKPEGETELSAGRATYNVVTDTVAGVNLRGSDNKFQAKFVFCSTILFACAGALLAIVITSWNLPWYGGALIGAFAGLVAGVFLSGIFLMIFRGVRHLQGKHD